MNKECKPPREDMIDVFYLSLKKGVERVKIAPLEVAQMHNDDEWVSQRLIDNHLECIVLKDIH